MFNQINMKQTFIKYLPCARLWIMYTKTIIKKGLVPALVELTVCRRRQPQTQQQSTREAQRRGTGSAWRMQGRLHRDGDNGAGPWMRSCSPGGGGGGSAFQAEDTAHEQAES